MSAAPDIQNLNAAQDAGLGARARIGLIVLQSDQTIEHEVASLLRQDGVALYHARIPNEMEVTCDTLRQMEADLPVAAGLLPTSFEFDAIGYCCTSGATMISEGRVDQILRSAHPQAKTSNPITACKAALRALGLKRIALITPYAPDVTVEMRGNLAEAGFEVNAIGTFNQSDDFKVARISSGSILTAIKEVGARTDCECVFVSCTSLRVLSVLAEAEAQLGKPVLSSNQVTAWHLARLAGIRESVTGAGVLFHTQLRSRDQ
ncbi:Asp/Glu/Hydantoin racemase family protein [Roseobacter sp. SK209-2-6]|uniref:maleate cis-trans isomerase family protein n=1 Tax=Roseobacter sp. SK209-2-6 TaxID=388739 RepID=UPI0000F3F620|nr:Asp/Glu racemase [Roseobacter sp. SK209-2-6]EBA18038.1 Asp/Glu/Hydantoin racemase family protein [Roseobacter sp. SK209-2-6]